MSFPIPPMQYAQGEEAQMRSEIQRRLDRKFDRQSDIELQAGQRLIMRSPDGNRWSITVSDIGVVSATAL